MTDAFDRLKNRSRATVPLRDASFTKEVNDSKTEFSHLSKVEEPPQSLSDSSDETFPEVTRRTIRLEQQVDEELERLCSRERITRETFLEAAYLACNDNPEILQEVLTIAKERYRRRKMAGEKRKFQTMGKKYES